MAKQKKPKQPGWRESIREKSSWEQLLEKVAAAKANTSQKKCRYHPGTVALQTNQRIPKEY